MSEYGRQFCLRGDSPLSRSNHSPTGYDFAPQIDLLLYRHLEPKLLIEPHIPYQLCEQSRGYVLFVYYLQNLLQQCLAESFP